MKIEGELQFIKNDRKSLTIENIWYNSFKPIDIKYKVGDNIVLEFGVKGNFNNIKSINYSNKAKPIECKPLVNLEVKESNNGNIKLISDQGKNTIIMQSVLIYLSDFDEENKSLKEITKMVRDAYKEI